MHARIVGNFLYPLHERLLRRPTFRLLGELEASQWLVQSKLRELQAAKLTRLFQHVAGSCERYADWFKDHPFDPMCDGPFDVLASLPLTDKESLRNRHRARSDDPRPPGVKPMSTGGSTGEPLTFLVDSMRSAFDKAARMRTHRWFGVEPGDKEAYLWGAPLANRRQDRPRTLRDWFLNDLLLSAFDLSPETARTYLRRMERFNPVCVFGYPSSLVKLAELADDAGHSPRLPALKAVFVTGEVLDDRQRTALETFFRVPVANGYGGRDSGFCAHECPEGAMHITSEHVILEIVDGEGRSVPHGHTGEIVVTNLDNYATPFVRYRTGDVGRRLDETCPCGRGLEIMDVVDGRRTDHLVAADGSLRHALSVIYMMRDLDEVDQFQIRQRKDRSINVRVVPIREISLATRDRVLSGMRDCLGHSLSATLEIVDRIDPQPSGKFRHVISDATDQSRARKEANPNEPSTQ